MTSQQPHPPGHDPSEKDLFPDAPDGACAEMNLDTTGQSPSFGSRLRAAREARGLDVETCGQALKLPSRVLRQLESDRHDGIDTQVYLGSYITKYGRHVGVEEAAIQAEVGRLRRQEGPALVATGGISHSRYLLERYATAATYVVLTAVIVVPMVWLGVRGTLNRDISHLAPLDAAPVAQQDLPAAARSSINRDVDVAAPRIDVPRTSADDQPLLASMVPSMAPDPKANTPETPVAGVGVGAHSLELALSQASWVEVVAADGTRLEYGLLAAGSHKTYHSDQPLEVRLGNATGADVRLDGEPVPLDGFRRANVAHFKVSLEDGKAVPHGA